MKIKKVLLMAPGTWNDIYYSRGEVNKAFKKTNWKEKNQIFIDFKDSELDAWVGFIANIRMEPPKSGRVYGDLYIAKWFADRLKDMKKAKWPVGVAPKVTGDVNKKIMKNFTFESFGLVYNPSNGKSCFT